MAWLRVRRHVKPLVAAIKANRPFESCFQPRLSAVRLSIPNSTRTSRIRMSIFASSSHTGPVRELGTNTQDFWNCFGGHTAAEARVYFRQIHACAEAFENQRNGKPSSADGRLTSEPFRIGNNPVIILVRLGLTFHSGTFA